MPDGLLYGVDMSFTPTLFTLGTGFMLVAGRMFEITAAESISISPGSGYARVYVAIDTGGTATENSFDQVSFGVDYAANLDSFAELTQGEININQGAAVYQAEVAVLTINSSGATAIERQMELVSPGAGTGAFAAIGVTYPAGSTVTVTDGKITYTAPNTSGAALFIIPYAATWIVSATDGTETASETVEITIEGQSVSVELFYSLWLYKAGNNKGGLVDEGYNISNFPSYSNSGATFGDNSILLKSTTSNNSGISYVGTPDSIDLTKYKRLIVTGTCAKALDSNKLNKAVFCVNTTKAIKSDGGDILGGRVGELTTEGTLVDIEFTASVSAYISFAVWGNTSSEAEITGIRLE